MSFKFALGAIVVLATSREAWQENRAEKEAEAARAEAGSDSAGDQGGNFAGVARLSARVESGKVIGRSEFPSAENNYLVLYADATGKQVEKWWAESQLFLDTEAEQPDGQERPTIEWVRGRPHEGKSEAVLFGGGGRPRSYFDLYFGGQRSGAKSEAEGFAEIWQSAYSAERNAEGSTMESATAAASIAIERFVSIRTGAEPGPDAAAGGDGAGGEAAARSE